MVQQQKQRNSTVLFESYAFNSKKLTENVPREKKLNLQAIK